MLMVVFQVACAANLQAWSGKLLQPVRQKRCSPARAQAPPQLLRRTSRAELMLTVPQVFLTHSGQEKGAVHPRHSLTIIVLMDSSNDTLININNI